MNTVSQELSGALQRDVQDISLGLFRITLQTVEAKESNRYIDLPPADREILGLVPKVAFEEVAASPVIPWKFEGLKQALDECSHGSMKYCDAAKMLPIAPTSLEAVTAIMMMGCLVRARDLAQIDPTQCRVRFRLGAEIVQQLAAASTTHCQQIVHMTRLRVPSSVRQILRTYIKVSGTKVTNQRRTILQILSRTAALNQEKVTRHG